jgi:hypothetical protein
MIGVGAGAANTFPLKYSARLKANDCASELLRARDMGGPYMVVQRPKRHALADFSNISENYWLDVARTSTIWMMQTVEKYPINRRPIELRGTP